MNKIWVFGALFLASCSTAIAPGAAGVVVVNERQALGPKCQMLGQLQSSSNWGGFAMTGAAYDEAMNSLKNQAAERGGTHLLLVNSSNSVGGTRMIADAYRCG